MVTHMAGCTGDIIAVTLKDLCSVLIACYPVKTKSSEETACWIQHFVGERKVGRMYSDCSLELISACKSLRIPHEKSQPGAHQTNSYAEINNQDIEMMTRAVLSTAGMPACVWPYAAPCVCFLQNIQERDGTSPWEATHKYGPFKGLKVPFGAQVVFKPSSTRHEYDNGKWEEDDVTGVFAGYDIQPGYELHGNYLVWPLEEFTQFSLRKDVSAENFKIKKPHIVQAMKLPVAALHDQ